MRQESSVLRGPERMEPAAAAEVPHPHPQNRDLSFKAHDSRLPWPTFSVPPGSSLMKDRERNQGPEAQQVSKELRE